MVQLSRSAVCSSASPAEARAVVEATSLALCAAVAGVLVATLAPFQITWPAQLRIDHVWTVRVQDVALNIALFAPLGFLLAMRRRVDGMANSAESRARP